MAATPMAALVAAKDAGALLASSNKRSEPEVPVCVRTFEHRTTQRAFQTLIVAKLFILYTKDGENAAKHRLWDFGVATNVDK